MRRQLQGDVVKAACIGRREELGLLKQVVFITLLSCCTRFHYVPVDGWGFRHGGVFCQGCGDSAGWMGLGPPISQEKRVESVVCWEGEVGLDLVGH